MKKTIFLSTIAAMLALLPSACSEDDGNYSYLSDEEAGIITIDTVGVENQYALSYSLTPGQHVEFEPRVSYKYPERLRYSWYYLTLNNYQYLPVQQGNSLVYPPADTICHTKKLDWTVDLNPGQYRFFLMAEDTITGMKGFFQASSYTQVASGGTLSGLYLLTERDGQTDLEVFTSGLMLIYGDQSCHYKYYSESMGKYLDGKPKFIRGTHTGKTSKNGYLVCTDKNLYRIAADGLQTMNDWSTMFYQTPENFNPQNAFYTNSCDFLVNDGKLHVLYANKANDRKFSAPVAGDYTSDAFLMKNTRTTWRPVEGAIDAWQVIYDKQNRKFRPYFSQASQVSSFKSTSSDAVVDANNVQGNVKAVFQSGGNYTTVITEIGDTIFALRYNFYNVVDNGDLSAAGSRSKINLNDCKDIRNARLFCSNTTGMAFYYATDKTVYSFSASSGQTTANTLYECESGETVTAMYAWGSSGGGWPTCDCALWIGVWNEQKQEGKLIQYEMDVNYGLPNSYWGPMFGAPDNPVITTGWGKIVDMVCLDAE